MRHPVLSALLALAAAQSSAAVIGVAPGPRGVSIEFHNTQGPCLGDAMLAVFSSPDGTKIPGCYLTSERAVRIVFLDGDVLTLPTAAVKRPTEL